MSWGPGFEVQPTTHTRSALRRTWPFAGVGAAAAALEPFTGGELDQRWWWIGLALVALGLTGALLAARVSSRPSWETVGGLVWLLGTGLVRHATYGASGGYGALVMLPIVWFTLYGNRRQLLTIITGASVVLVVPMVLIGGDRYPATGWRGSLVLIGVGALSGLAAQHLRNRLADQTEATTTHAGELRDALEAMADPIARYEVLRDDGGRPVDLRCILLNAAGREMLGDATIGELMSERLAQRGRSEMLDLWLSAVDAHEPIQYETVSQNWQSGRVVVLQLVRIHNGVLATWRDVTNERKMEESLRQSLGRWQSVADAAADASLVLDRAFQVLHVSSSIADLVGLDQSAALGKSVLKIISADDLPLVVDTLTAALASDERRTIEFRVLDLRNPGEHVWLEGRVAGMGTDESRELNIGLRDINAAHLERTALGYQATHDPMTGLLNRAGLQAQLDACADRKIGVQLLYLDLDRFKPINDVHGHGAGDQVLVEVANRLMTTIRASESAARIGGDEFAIISHALTTRDAIDGLVGRVKASVAAPITLADGTVVSVTASVGLATASALTAVDELLMAADHEMYRSKRDTNTVRLT